MEECQDDEPRIETEGKDDREWRYNNSNGLRMYTRTCVWGDENTTTTTTNL